MLELQFHYGSKYYLLYDMFVRYTRSLNNVYICS